MNKNEHLPEKHPFDIIAERGMQSANEKLQQDSLRRLDQRFADKYTTKSVRLRYLWRLSLAASVALLLWGAYHFSQPPLSKFDFSPDAPLTITPLAANRTSETLPEEKLHQARSLYEQRSYPEAVALFREYVSMGGEKTEVLLYIGHCELQFEPEQAIITLLHFKEKAINQLDDNYLDMADWYLAWAYYNTNQPDQAAEVLKHLMAKSDKFSAAAKQFLGRIQPIHR